MCLLELRRIFHGDNLMFGIETFEAFIYYHCYFDKCATISPLQIDSDFVT